MSSTVHQSEVSAAPDAGALRRQWQTEGYVLVRGLFPPDESARLLEICEHVRRQCVEFDPTLGHAGANDDSVSIRHLNHPAYFRDRPDWLATMLDACADPRALRVARS